MLSLTHALTECSASEVYVRCSTPDPHLHSQVLGLALKCYVNMGVTISCSLLRRAELVRPLSEERLPGLQAAGIGWLLPCAQVVRALSHPGGAAGKPPAGGRPGHHAPRQRPGYAHAHAGGKSRRLSAQNTCFSVWVVHRLAHDLVHAGGRAQRHRAGEYFSFPKVQSAVLRAPRHVPVGNICSGCALTCVQCHLVESPIAISSRRRALVAAACEGAAFAAAHRVRGSIYSL